MRKYYKNKEVTIPIYKGKLVVIATNDVDRINKEFEGVRIHDLFAHQINGSDNGYDGYFLIFNFNHEYPITHGIIAHEALHACCALFRNRGVFPDHENSEPMAYLIEWIVNFVHESLSEFKMKLK